MQEDPLLLELPNSLEGHYEYIFENIRDIIFTLSLDGRITSVTREFENSTGWSRDEWLGKHFQDLVHPEDIEGVIQGFKDVISGDLPAPYEARVKSKSGDILTFEAKSAPFIINNKITGYLGIARDITKRKEMEEALRTSKHQYRDIIDSLGDAIHVVNKDRQIILNNPAFSNWLEELNINSDIKGKTVLEAFPFLEKKVIEELYNLIQSDIEKDPSIRYFAAMALLNYVNSIIKAINHETE